MKKLYSILLATLFALSAWSQAPKADLLDVVFNADGSATDVSAAQCEIEAMGNPKVVASPQYGMNVFCATANTWNGTPSQWYRIPISDEIWNKYAEGFTIESFFRCFWEGDNAPTSWATVIGMEEGGGFGILTDGGKWCTEAHVGGGYKDVYEDIPVKGEWVHFVGVWNKEEGLLYLYKNGELVGTVGAEGDLQQPNSSDGLFMCIASDLWGGHSDTGQAGFCGDIATARLYSKPLTAEEVAAVYAEQQAKNTGAEEHQEGSIFDNVRYDEEQNMLIATPEELHLFGQLTRRGFTVNAKLEADIDYTGYNESLSTSSNPFRGTFDGQFHKITIHMNLDYGDCGLFDYFHGAHVMNLWVDGEMESSGDWTGGLVGDDEGSVVENIISTVKVTSTYDGYALVSPLSGFAGNGDKANYYRNILVNGSVTFTNSGTGAGGVVADVKHATYMDNVFAICPVYPSATETNSNPIYSRDRNGTFYCNNVYYADDVEFADLVSGIQKVEMDDAMNGAMCYMLNNFGFDSPVFFQTIGNDELPSFDATKGIVVKTGKADYRSVTDDASLAECAQLLASNESEEAEELEAYAPLKESYQAAIEEVGAATAWGDFVAAYKEMKAARALVDENVVAYNKLQEEVSFATSQLDGMTSNFALLLLEYLTEESEPTEDFVNGTFPYIYANKTLDTEGVNGEFDYIEEMLKRVKASTSEAGTDVSILIQNADFTKNTSGWNTGTAGFSFVHEPNAGRIYNQYNGKIYQTLTGLKNGIYEFDMNSFVEIADLADNNNHSAFLFANGNYVPVMTISEGALPFEEAEDSVNCLITDPGTNPCDLIWQDEYYIPGWLAGGAYAFKGGRYENKIVTNVTDGTLTIGLELKGSGASNDWLVFGNARLIYQGEENEASESLQSVLNGMYERAKTTIAYEAQADGENYLYYPNFSKALRDKLGEYSPECGKDLYTQVEEMSKLFLDIYDCKQAYRQLAKDLVAYFDRIYDYPEYSDIINKNSDAAWDEWLAGTYSAEEALAKGKALLAEMDSYEISVPTPDLADVIFNADGTATDQSPLQQTVERMGNPSVVASPTWGRNVFCSYGKNDWGGHSSDFFRILPSEALLEGISDGYTAEALVRPTWEGDGTPGSWASVIGFEQVGGFGILMEGGTWRLETRAGGGYHTAIDPATPWKDEWIHMVGVWNPEDGQAYFYVNGEFKGAIDAAGDFGFPNGSRENWFIGIGGDYTGSMSDYQEAAIQGDIAVVRIYNEAVNGSQVRMLYNNMMKENTGAAEHVEGEGEAVESIAAEGNHSGAIYNLSGQKVEKAEKGIYIVGNKKIAY